MNDPDINLLRARWPDDQVLLRQVREAVFVREQGVPPALEWDGQDAQAVHLLAIGPQGLPVGTARLLADGKIGRMAVLANWRGRGIGSALLRELLAIIAAEGFPQPYLDAQTSATEFYQRQGFAAEGEVFLDAGIPHCRMRRDTGGNP